MVVGCPESGVILGKNYWTRNIKETIVLVEDTRPRYVDIAGDGSDPETISPF